MKDPAPFYVIQYLDIGEVADTWSEACDLVFDRFDGEPINDGDLIVTHVQFDAPSRDETRRMMDLHRSERGEDYGSEPEFDWVQE